MSDAVAKKLLEEARVKYLQAKELSTKSENVASEPYKNKYKAAEIFRDLHTQLSEMNKTDSDFKLSLLSALLNYELGVIEYETEELSASEKHLEWSWEFLKENPLKPECVILTMNALNQLGILWSGRNEPKKAVDYLKQAEIIYGEYKLENHTKPSTFSDLFLNEIPEDSDNSQVFENTLTHTLYYLAQVYEHLGESETSAKYCHITLRRQLESKDYDPLDWALNSATLSQYFIAKEQLSAARHVLACALYVVREFEAEYEKKAPIKEEEKVDFINRCKADIYRCWTKYALHLLIISRDTNINAAESKDPPKKSDSDDYLKLHRLLKEDVIKDLENQVICDLILSFEEARKVFLFGIQCLDKSKKYYILNDYTYDHVQIIQDNSKFYKFLAFFEQELDRKCKMHKRRVDMLEAILKQLNSQFYLALCRQLIFELAETYSEIMDLKILAASSDKTNMTPHAMKKVNYLATKGIDYFNSFISTLKDSNGEIPATLSDDVVRPALIAYFCQGRLYSKIIVTNASDHVKFLKKNEECYNFIVKYIEKNPKHEEHIREELAVVKDMLELIPGKIQAILSTTLF